MTRKLDMDALEAMLAGAIAEVLWGFARDRECEGGDNVGDGRRIAEAIRAMIEWKPKETGTISPARMGAQDCPFCGSAANPEYGYLWYVKCSNDKCTLAHHGWFMLGDWNNLASRKSTDQRG
jgi:hypothetical protein